MRAAGDESTSEEQSRNASRRKDSVAAKSRGERVFCQQQNKCCNLQSNLSSILTQRGMLCSMLGQRDRSTRTQDSQALVGALGRTEDELAVRRESPPGPNDTSVRGIASKLERAVQEVRVRLQQQVAGDASLSDRRRSGEEKLRRKPAATKRTQLGRQRRTSPSEMAPL